MTTTRDAWLTETPEDADERDQARQTAREARTHGTPDTYSVSDYDRWVPSTGADGVTRYSRVNLLDYIN